MVASKSRRSYVFSVERIAAVFSSENALLFKAHPIGGYIATRNI